jgi:hypothetical protein
MTPKAKEREVSQKYLQSLTYICCASLIQNTWNRSTFGFLGSFFIIWNIYIYIMSYLGNETKHESLSMKFI